jgi:uncharacterized membrane protein YqjE
VTIEQREQGQDGMRERLRRGRQEFDEVSSDFSDLTDDLTVLARKEMELARTEMGEQANLAIRGLVWGGVTGICAVLLLTFVFLTIMFALYVAMPLWVAALATTCIILAATTIAALLTYIHFKRISVVPKRTLKSVREDVQWAKRQLNLNAR